MWRWVPVAGGAVKDVRHLVGALDEATSMAEIGTEVYPDLMQSDSLVQNTQVDLDQLDAILDELNRPGQHLRAASDDLDAVDGSTPFVGDKILERARQGSPPHRPAAGDVRRGGAGARRAARRARCRRREQLPRGDHEPRRAALLRRRDPDPRAADHGRGQDRVRRDRHQRGHLRPAPRQDQVAQGEGQPVPPARQDARGERHVLAVLDAVGRGAAPRLGGALREEVPTASSRST